MERMKKIVLFFVFFILTAVPVYSETVSSSTAKQVYDVNECVKTFPVGYEKLYYLTLAAINHYNYNIEEIQTKNGYILFSKNNREFLAVIVYVSNNKSLLKITPADCKYNFSSELTQGLFNYIETYYSKSF